MTEPTPMTDLISRIERAGDLRVVVHTGNGATIRPEGDWTVFAGDVALLDERGLRGPDSAVELAKAIQALTHEIGTKARQGDRT